MVVGIILLAFLATVLAVLLLGGTGEDPGVGAVSSSPPASTNASATAGPSTDTPSIAPSADASESPAPSGIAVDSLVETTVENLSVRRAPSTGAERLGSLGLGTVGYVVDGPVDADGFSWYAVSALGLPPNSGCITPIETDPYGCPVWFGWLAGRASNGDPWLEPHAIECPIAPLDAERLILARSDIERLACFDSESITFRAFWPEIPDDAGLGGACAAASAPSGWLYCQNINIDYVTLNEGEGFGGVGVALSIDPASNVVMPPRGTWIELTVHLDDPAADGCADAADMAGDEYRELAQVILDCRAEMVVETVLAVAGP